MPLGVEVVPDVKKTQQGDSLSSPVKYSKALLSIGSSKADSSLRFMHPTI